jgi:TadE-like protein
MRQAKPIECGKLALGRLWARRNGRHPGQALIEFAFFFTFMMLLLAGVTDVAFLEDAHENVVFAARQGARTAAVLGPGCTTQTCANPANPDCAIVGAVYAALQNQSDVTVQSIIIYKALPSSYTPTATYEEVYPAPTQCAAGATDFPSGQGPSVNTYPASIRSNTPFQEDSIGVQIVYTYQFRFNLWESGTLTLTDQAVYPISPSGIPTPIP